MHSSIRRSRKPKGVKSPCADTKSVIVDRWSKVAEKVQKATLLCSHSSLCRQFSSSINDHRFGISAKSLHTFRFSTTANRSVHVTFPRRLNLKIAGTQFSNFAPKFFKNFIFINEWIFWVGIPSFNPLRPMVPELYSFKIPQWLYGNPVDSAAAGKKFKFPLEAWNPYDKTEACVALESGRSPEARK